MFAPLVDFFTGRSSAWKAKYNAAFVTLVNPNTGEPYVASGGGGGGSSLTDVVLQDANNVLVLQRDDGTTLTYLRLDTGLAYTPVLPLVSPTTPVTGPLTNTQLRATAVPVSVSGVATADNQLLGNTTLTSIDTDIGQPSAPVATTDTGTFSLISLTKRLLQKFATPLVDTPSFDQSAQPVRFVGQNTAGAGFSAVGASVLDQFFVQTPIVGTGVSYNQANGALNIFAGITANAEFLARSTAVFRGSMRLRHTIISSQRIANNNFAVLLADLIGEGLAVTINSATSITVAIPGNTFNATNVGQFVLVGGIVGAAGVPGRYAIASVAPGVSINLTVAGWPASGSCTATLFGRNYIRHLFTGTTATNVNFDAQRNGWATGDTTATTLTTASPGLMMQAELTGREIFFSDSLRASSTSPTVTTRASRYENIPDQSTELYVFLWNFNGTGTPASSTTWTIGSLSVESFANVPVYLQGNRSLGQQNSLPVTLTGTNTVGTVTTVATAGTPAVPATPFFVNSAAGTNGALILAGTSGVQAFYASNTGTIAYVKLYNKATAPVVGTDVPEMVITVPANGQIELTPGFNGYRFPLGLGIAITGLPADTDTTAVAAGQVKVKLSRTV